MNEYLFTTIEGITVSPNLSDVENCQLLARVDALNETDAYSRLFEENEWISESGFSPEVIMVDQVITKEQISDIKAIVDYLWEDEECSYEENGCPQDHIIVVLKRLKEMIVDYK